MQALAFGSDRQFVLRERPTPEPDAGDALLRVHYSGICGTDLHAQSLGHYSADVVIGQVRRGVSADQRRKRRQDIDADRGVGARNYKGDAAAATFKLRLRSYRLTRCGHM